LPPRSQSWPTTCLWAPTSFILPCKSYHFKSQLHAVIGPSSMYHLTISSVVHKNDSETFSLGIPLATTTNQTSMTNCTPFHTSTSMSKCPTCTSDQRLPLIISLAIGFFLAFFLSFLKQADQKDYPPRNTSHMMAGFHNRNVSSAKAKCIKWVYYKEGCPFYLDFSKYVSLFNALISLTLFLIPPIALHVDH
jgi:hypothetical protein